MLNTPAKKITSFQFVFTNSRKWKCYEQEVSIMINSRYWISLTLLLETLLSLLSKNRRKWYKGGMHRSLNFGVLIMICGCCLVCALPATFLE